MWNTNCMPTLKGKLNVIHIMSAFTFIEISSMSPIEVFFIGILSEMKKIVNTFCITTGPFLSTSAVL